jgi:hypothetical protein
LAIVELGQAFARLAAHFRANLSEAVRRLDEVGRPGGSSDVSEKTPFPVSSHTGSMTVDENGPNGARIPS